MISKNDRRSSANAMNRWRKKFFETHDSPCKYCERRHVGCHADCKDEQEFMYMFREKEAEAMLGCGLDAVTLYEYGKLYGKN